MKTALNNCERRILEELISSSKGLNAFILFRRTKQPFKDFVRGLGKLSECDFVEEKSEDFYVVTQNGIVGYNKTRAHNLSKDWKKIPEQFSSEKVDVKSKYVPSLRALDSRTFEKLLNQLERQKLLKRF